MFGCLVPLLGANPNKRTYRSDLRGYPQWSTLLSQCNLENRSGKYFSLSELEDLLRTVNDDVNQRFDYRTDFSDVWKTPAQFEQDGWGDCEDFATYKMHRLLQEGIAADNMEIVICRYRQADTRHVVLRVFTEYTWFVLDCVEKFVLSPTSFPLRYRPETGLSIKGWREL